MRQNSGYPAAYWKSLRRFLIRYLLFVAVTLALFCGCAYAAIYKNGDIAVAAGLGGFSLYLLLVLYFSIKSKPKLALYFEAKVPGSWVWSAPLARNCVFLDELCNSLGVTVLSSFGFTDDWSGKTMIWHAPEQGLETVTALIRQLRHDATVLTEGDVVLADLQKLNNRLREAEKQGVRFCFILHEGGMNAMEMERRCGHF